MSQPISISRRDAIARFGGGLATLGLLASLPGAATALPNVLLPAKTLPHFRPRAKRVIHLFMNGGPFGPDFSTPSRT